MRIGHATPILRSFDEMKARAFYVDFLGFKVDWEHRFGPGMPLYMQVSRDELIIHLSEHHGDATPGSAMRIELDDVDAFHAEVSERRYANAKPDGAKDQPWGTRDMTLTDPSGNKLIFFTQLPQ